MFPGWLVVDFIDRNYSNHQAFRNLEVICDTLNMFFEVMQKKLFGIILESIQCVASQKTLSHLEQLGGLILTHESFLAIKL